MLAYLILQSSVQTQENLPKIDNCLDLFYVTKSFYLQNEMK